MAQPVRADQAEQTFGIFPAGFQFGPQARPQCFGAIKDLIADGVLELIPDLLCRIKFGTIGRQFRDQHLAPLRPLRVVFVRWLVEAGAIP